MTVDDQSTTAELVVEGGLSPTSSSPTVTIYSLAEVKKQRRINSVSPTHASVSTMISIPLTPPLSERASSSIAEDDDDDSSQKGSGDENESGRSFEHLETQIEGEEIEREHWGEIGREDDRERDENQDEATAYLLARLEAANLSLLSDPTHRSLPSRPSSILSLRQILESSMSSSREHPPNLPRKSRLPSPPPITDLDFWAACVRDYARVANHLPHLLQKKLTSGGIPPPLRGLVWSAMAGITQGYQEDMTTVYMRLSAQDGIKGCFDKDIGRDLMRTWPKVEMFREESGEGVRGLKGVLASFSIWDGEVGYCQGLGFLVGPLLMNLPPAQAFTLLTVLMSTSPSQRSQPRGYSLRTLYVPNFPGLLLRIHQFSTLLNDHFPQLAAHLTSVGVTVEMFAPQWFLSLFAVTGVHLEGMLMRIWDLVISSGGKGGDTVCRIGLALMRKNEVKLLGMKEMESALPLLLGPELWACFEGNADELIFESMEMSGFATDERLLELETDWSKMNVLKRPMSRMEKGGREGLEAVVGRFMGKLRWGGISSPTQLTVEGSPPPMGRIESKQSLSPITPGPEIKLDPSETLTIKRANTDGVVERSTIVSRVGPMSESEKALHEQIEELVRVLGEVQRRVGEGENEIQKLKEENDSMKEVLCEVKSALEGEVARDGVVHSPDREQELKELENKIDLLVTSPSLASPLSYSPLSESRNDVRAQLIEKNEELEAERQASNILQQQLDFTETELSRTRALLNELKNKLAEADKTFQQPYLGAASIKKSDHREKSGTTGSNNLISVSPTWSGGLRELKLITRTRSTSPEHGRQGGGATVEISPNSGSAEAKTMTGGSWGGWFGR